jgi:hypothetical protein
MTGPVDRPWPAAGPPPLSATGRTRHRRLREQGRAVPAHVSARVGAPVRTVG